MVVEKIKLWSCTYLPRLIPHRWFAAVLMLSLLALFVYSHTHYHYRLQAQCHAYISEATKRARDAVVVSHYSSAQDRIWKPYADVYKLSRAHKKYCFVP